MRLFEAIIDANHRAAAGDAEAGLRPDDYAGELPVVALTCIDPRLNRLFPDALGVPAEQFIWLRNAGNIITGPLTSTMRSLALACAVKGGREIAIIGHTDCQVAKTTTMVLLDKLQALGVDRSRLPENLNEFFGMFGSERQNVIKGCDFARNSPLIGPTTAVHGLLIDIATGKLDWVVNGYESLPQPGLAPMPQAKLPSLGALGSFADFSMGEMKFPEMKIGDAALEGRLSETQQTEAKPAMIIVPPVLPSSSSSGLKAKLPPLRLETAPPPIRPRPKFQR